ncbi:hypothetical protein GCM10020358_67110 [Amorphoplanes nipponensis]|uniref:Uncharacterized protein n=1 Tax=Actinoplanes nipponensis TaxID=135950 RepID=A0A919MR30_9ACTN|nr:hypothetical protein Ani05nite_73310 [Actinoplanes nipponensis]
MTVVALVIACHPLPVPPFGRDCITPATVRARPAGLDVALVRKPGPGPMPISIAAHCPLAQSMPVDFWPGTGGDALLGSDGGQPATDQGRPGGTGSHGQGDHEGGKRSPTRPGVDDRAPPSGAAPGGVKPSGAATGPGAPGGAD